MNKKQTTNEFLEVVTDSFARFTAIGWKGHVGHLYYYKNWGRNQNKWHCGKCKKTMKRKQHD